MEARRLRWSLHSLFLSLIAYTIMSVAMSLVAQAVESTPQKPNIISSAIQSQQGG